MRIFTSREERDEETRAKEAVLTADLKTKLPLQTSAIQFIKHTVKSLFSFAIFQNQFYTTIFYNSLKYHNDAIQTSENYCEFIKINFIIEKS